MKLVKANFKKRRRHPGEGTPPDSIFYRDPDGEMSIERGQVYELADETDLEGSPYPKIRKEIVKAPALAGIFSDVEPKKSKKSKTKK